MNLEKLNHQYELSKLIYFSNNIGCELFLPIYLVGKLGTSLSPAKLIDVNVKTETLTFELHGQKIYLTISELLEILE